MTYYSNTNYLVFNVSELDKVSFELILETNASTVRKSVDKTKTFVSWWGSEPPPFVSSLTTKSSIYTYDEIIQILEGAEWTDLNV